MSNGVPVFSGQNFMSVAPTPPVTPLAPVYVNGVRIATAASAPAFSPVYRPLTRLEDLAFNVSAPARTQAYVNDFYKDIARRAGALPTARDAQTPRPKIEIANLPDNTSEDPRTVFREFILTNIQEQDAEKTEVTETFGAPHLFASGRFIRRVTITGMTRTSPVNYTAPAPGTTGQVPDLAVPQSLSLRTFYENYLRVSLMAQRRQYARLTVDGEVYSGWFTTFNAGRDSHNEHFATFTMSMYVFDRSNALDSRAKAQYPAVASTKTTAWADKKAKANKDAQTGNTTLSLSASTADTTGQISAVGTRPALTGAVTLTVGGSGTQLKVTANSPGLTLTIGSGGLLTPIGTWPVQLAVTDADAFLKSLEGPSDAVGTELVTFTITPTHGSSVTLPVNVGYDVSPTSLQYRGAEAILLFDAAGNSRISNTVVESKTIGADNTFSFIVQTVFSDSKGKEVTLSTTPVVTLTNITATPVISALNGTKTGDSTTMSFLLPVVTAGIPTPDGQLGSYRTAFTVKFPSPGTKSYAAGGSPSPVAESLEVKMNVVSTVAGAAVAGENDARFNVSLPDTKASTEVFKSATLTGISLENVGSSSKVKILIDTQGAHFFDDLNQDWFSAKSVFACCSAKFTPTVYLTGSVLAGAFSDVTRTPTGYAVWYSLSSSRSPLAAGDEYKVTLTLPSGYTPASLTAILTP